MLTPPLDRDLVSLEDVRVGTFLSKSCVLQPLAVQKLTGFLKGRAYKSFHPTHPSVLFMVGPSPDAFADLSRAVGALLLTDTSHWIEVLPGQAREDIRTLIDNRLSQASAARSESKHHTSAVILVRDHATAAMCTPEMMSGDPHAVWIVGCVREHAEHVSLVYQNYLEKEGISSCQSKAEKEECSKLITVAVADSAARDVFGELADAGFRARAVTGFVPLLPVSQQDFVEHTVHPMLVQACSDLADSEGVDITGTMEAAEHIAVEYHTKTEASAFIEDRLPILVVEAIQASAMALHRETAGDDFDPEDLTVREERDLVEKYKPKFGKVRVVAGGSGEPVRVQTAATGPPQLPPAPTSLTPPPSSPTRQSDKDTVGEKSPQEKASSAPTPPGTKPPTRNEAEPETQLPPPPPHATEPAPRTEENTQRKPSPDPPVIASEPAKPSEASSKPARRESTSKGPLGGMDFRRELTRRISQSSQRRGYEAQIPEESEGPATTATEGGNEKDGGAEDLPLPPPPPPADEASPAPTDLAASTPAQDHERSQSIGHGQGPDAMLAFKRHSSAGDVRSRPSPDDDNASSIFTSSPSINIVRDGDEVEGGNGDTDTVDVTSILESVVSPDAEQLQARKERAEELRQERAIEKENAKKADKARKLAERKTKTRSGIRAFFSRSKSVSHPSPPVVVSPGTPSSQGSSSPFLTPSPLGEGSYSASPEMNGSTLDANDSSSPPTNRAVSPAPYEAALREKDSQIAERDQRLAEKDQLLAVKQQLIDEGQKELDEKTQAMQSMMDEYVGVKIDRAELENQLATKTTELDEALAEIASLQAQLKKKTAAVTELVEMTKKLTSFTPTPEIMSYYKGHLNKLLLIQQTWRHVRRQRKFKAIVGRVTARVVTRNKKRRELLDSERSYVNDITATVRNFLSPLRKTKDVSANDLQLMFGNLEAIVAVNTQLLEELEARFAQFPAVKTVGDIYLRMVPLLRTYIPYATNFDNVLATVARLSSTNKNFDKFQKEQQKQQPSLRGLDLSSLLIMPIQRIMRYKLLLQALLDSTAEEHPDYCNLVEALKKIDELASEVNKKKGEAENRLAVYNVAKKLKVEKKDDPNVRKLAGGSLIAPHRQYLREGHLPIEGNPKAHRCWFFLFNDLLIHAALKQKGSWYRVEDLIELADLQITDLPGTEEHPYRFQIECDPPMIVAPSSQGLMDQWLKAIRDAIQVLESNRMSRSFQAARSKFVSA